MIGADTAPTHDHLFKLLLIGNSGVGKSNMLLRFADDVYNEKSDATIGVDFKICTRHIDGKMIKLQIWDTAGQERFRTITSSYYRGSQGIVVVYDVTDRESFDHVRMWMQEVEKYTKADTYRIVVGNKIDLTYKRVVAYDEGKDLADELGVRFMETSAKNSHNIENAFDLLCKEVAARLRPEPKERSAQARLTLGVGALSFGSGGVGDRIRCCT